MAMWIVKRMRYRETDQPTDRPMDSVSFRGALLHLKRETTFSQTTCESTVIFKRAYVMQTAKVAKSAKRKQGGIHGHQLWTGGQGRKSAFSPLFNSIITDQRTDQRTDGRTKSLIELRVRN